MKHKRKLETVTLLGIDCVDAQRLSLAMEICQKDFEFANVKLLTSLKASKLKNVVKIKPLNSVEKYSRFVLEELDKYVETEYVLIVQYDGFILNSKVWTDEFLKYDYIGAPWLVADWSVKNFDFPPELMSKLVVGNGGFSLRSKKLLSLTSKLIKKGTIERYNPEDVAICVYYRKLFEDNGIKFAPVKLAKQFSFESEDRLHFTWDGQFGFHGLKWTDISKWAKIHPEYKIENPAINKNTRLKYL
jgi:hypothetical protein